MVPRKLKGFRDYTPDLCYSRWKIIETARKWANLAGFVPVDTPSLEYYETLVGEAGGETEKQIYHFLDQGDRQVGLRFDLTVPFTRFVAEHRGDLPIPFKRFQVGNVWRGEKPQKGRYREFCQADLDCVGVDDRRADYDIISTFINIINEVSPRPCTIRLGNRAILSALLRQHLGSADESGALIAIDKLEKVGPEKVTQLLVEAGGESASAERLLGLLTAKSPSGGSDLSSIDGEESDRFQLLVEDLARTSPGGVDVELDLSIARGLGYYTGVVFETFVDDLPGFGSIGSGGRYNDLVSRFSKTPLPGVGGSVGVDRLLAAYEELNHLAQAPIPPIVCLPADGESHSYAMAIAQQLRDRGIACELGLGSKLGNQLKRESKQKRPFVIVVGDRERQAQTVLFKEMKAGTEQAVSLADLPSFCTKKMTEME